jgi:uncharacterized membrane protein YphA (DoxX/SURF4 family)
MSFKFDNLFKKFAPSVLRIGISLVFIWFGLQQLTDAALWLGYVPDAIVAISHVSITTLVHFNGAFELIFGLALLAGLFTRTTALLLALHMIDIVIIVGYTSIGIRDFGVAVATIAIFLYGADAISLDMLYLKHGKNRVE